ncbi:hypothetical protein ACFL1Q_02735 [Patescibacteria group bacterium]
MNKTLKKTAQQIAQEPLEILKRVPQQVVGKEVQVTPKESKEEEKQQPPSEDVKMMTQNDKLKSQRLVDAYEREMKDIKNQNLLKELQRKISQGEQVYLEEYPQLSIEQKQVLKAQIEAVEKQKEDEKQADDKVLVEPTPKKSRRFTLGKKSQVEKQQTKVERPLPPSG